MLYVGEELFAALIVSYACFTGIWAAAVGPAVDANSRAGTF